MTKVRTCVLYLDPMIDKAVHDEAVQTDYERTFKRRVSMSARVERILFQYFKEHDKLPKNP